MLDWKMTRLLRSYSLCNLQMGHQTVDTFTGQFCCGLILEINNEEKNFNEEIHSRLRSIYQRKKEHERQKSNSHV